jgi:protein-disulfide isomerase
VVVFTVGCSAQPQGASGPELEQRLERQVRVQYRVPPQVEVEIGSRKPSEFAGYDVVEVAIFDGRQRSNHEFLLSHDGKTLVRFQRMDISSDPYADIMAKIDLSGRASRGAADAKVVIVNYDDLQCPYCSQMHKTLFGGIMQEYGDRVRVVYKDFPLQAWARRAAINANCLLAQDEDAYWRYVDTVHDTHRQISARQPAPARNEELDRLAMEAASGRPVSEAGLAACLREQPDAAVRASLEEGAALGVEGTPTLFINGIRIPGAIPGEQLRTVLNRALRDAGVEPPERPAEAAAAGSTPAEQSPQQK